MQIPIVPLTFVQKRNTICVCIRVDIGINVRVLIRMCMFAFTRFFVIIFVLAHTHCSGADVLVTHVLFIEIIIAIVSIKTVQQVCGAIQDLETNAKEGAEDLD